ncbi:flagellar basal body P-ring formation chaperone FlgA [Porticoccaceae bacterium LTM1]|nr:flagellar basal body P-ring formation chaperone FlgA [Porticoccaceae bacterium LTM1]
MNKRPARQNRTSVRSGLLIALLLPWLTGNADGIQSHESIRATAEGFVSNQPAIQQMGDVKVIAGQLNNSLQLPLCSVALEAFLPPGGKLLGKTSIGVRCRGESPWTLYVPVTVTATQAVPVATRTLRRGEVLSAEDVSLMEQPLHQLPAGYFEKASEAIGQEATRNIQAGSTLTQGMLAAPKVIKRGQQVTLIAGSDSFEVRMNGKALSDAAVGDRLRVENLSSKKIVEGTVKDTGEVVVGN